MVVRIVKLTFAENKVEEFKAFFENIKHVVNDFEGCKGMQMLQNMEDPKEFMTYSVWKNEQCLNKYRSSADFGKIWPTIKPWFIAAPQAWTNEVLFNGFELK